MRQKRSQWASNLGFVLATAGSAVGLGNIWKFPGKVGANGGGAFILIYIVIVAAIGFPVMLAELAIGRGTQKNMVGALRTLNKRWAFAGKIGILTLFVIMSYYCVVGGWVLKYILVYITGAHFGGGTTQYQDYFVNFIRDWAEPLAWDLLFLILCIYIIIRGVSQGIERVSKALMPCLLLLLMGIAIRSATLPGAKEGLKFMLTIDPADFNRNTLIAALGQAFFSLSVGMGILITYGSYVPRTENLIKSSAWICILDTLVAFLAAFAIIPAVFVTLGPEGLGMGGGFAFMVLPEVFASLPGEVVFGTVFYILLFFAALTSAISILESCVAYLTEEFGINRFQAAVGLGAGMSILSAGYSLSQDPGRGINLPWFHFSSGLQMLPMNSVMEKFTDDLMIPLGALLFCIFTGWVWGAQNAAAEIEGDTGTPFVLKTVWSFAIRFLAPGAIGVIMYFTLWKGQGLS